MNKVIKNESDYEETLLRLNTLLTRNPSEGTREDDELEVLVLLIQDYESRQSHLIAPSPVEAIKFRMEQQDLTPRDLIPYIGSRSKVSEILSGKRQLTLPMIRALNSGLGIPATILIQSQCQDKEMEIVDWDRFPIKQMIAWGWIAAPDGTSSIKIEEILRSFFRAAGPIDPEVVLCRSSTTSSHKRSVRVMDDYALIAWSAQVLTRAARYPTTVTYQSGTLTLDFLQEIARISSSEKGPLIVRDFLGKYGIRVVVERHPPGTYLDGAAIIVDKLHPVIGLTLRYDRVDNFWFTLMHELAHLALHLETDNIFYDDLDIEAEGDSRERDADKLAGEALIPDSLWDKSPASRLRSPEAAEHLAKQLQIHPAIVAGRMRHEFKAYRLLNNLVGHRMVRRLFPETSWGDDK